MEINKNELNNFFNCCKELIPQLWNVLMLNLEIIDRQLQPNTWNISSIQKYRKKRKWTNQVSSKIAIFLMKIKVFLPKKKSKKKN